MPNSFSVCEAVVVRGVVAQGYNVNDERVAKSKHNCDVVVFFIKQTTCFGYFIGPSSGLNFRVAGDYTLRVFSLKIGSYRVNEISLFCGTVMYIKL
jgi:hypothetical protein